MFDTRYNIETFLIRRGTCAAKTRISWLLLFLQYGMNKLLEPEFLCGEVSCVTGRREGDKIGPLSKDDDDGSENVAKKMNLRSFKHNRVYLDPLNMSNAGDFSWS